ncbi:hypothetical protein Aru02nite_71240 [Actinocatenispora rupis]|uniref:Uncharacterized protein n=1 Tax=Actinocatenispora rupis TaxID=519421 RepID=A0A8J3NGQ5_9ACTN|nr:hypothetical protein Aru02nite_71240 [Actinocatenispora rupis]
MAGSYAPTRTGETPDVAVHNRPPTGSATPVDVTSDAGPRSRTDGDPVESAGRAAADGDDAADGGWDGGRAGDALAVPAGTSAATSAAASMSRTVRTRTSAGITVMTLMISAP